MQIASPVECVHECLRQKKEFGLESENNTVVGSTWQELAKFIADMHLKHFKIRCVELCPFSTVTVENSIASPEIAS